MGSIIDLHEREVRVLPRDWFVDPRGKSKIFPEVRNLSAFEIKDTAEGVKLRVLGLIGHLPITPDIILNLRPKFPTENLWFMLENGDEDFKAILPVVRSYQIGDQSAPHQLLARSFTYYIRKIIAVGWSRNYIAERVSGYFKPKVAFGPTIAHSLARGEPAKTISDVFTFTMGTRLNGLLKTACRHFLGVMPPNALWKSDRDCLMDALASLSRVKECDLLPSDLRPPANLPRQLQAAYTGALTSYSVLRGHTNIGFEYVPQGAQLPSFLFNLDRIFEDFVRKTLRMGLRNHLLSVVDGNKVRHQHALFSDNATYPVKPDLIIKSGKQITAVGEVKYKPKISEVDRYQLLSHTLAVGSPRGFWVSPAPSPEDSGIKYVGRFSDKASFWHYRIDLSNNIEMAAQLMTEEVLGLIAPFKPEPLDA